MLLWEFVYMAPRVGISAVLEENLSNHRLPAPKELSSSEVQRGLSILDSRCDGNFPFQVPPMPTLFWGLGSAPYLR